MTGALPGEIDARDVYKVFDPRNVVELKYKNGESLRILRGSYREFYPKNGEPPSFLAVLEEEYYQKGEMIIGGLEEVMAFVFLPPDDPIPPMKHSTIE